MGEIMLESVIEDLKRHEGFRPTPYQCTEGVWTIGYGFTNLTPEEAETILNIRVERLHQRLSTYQWYCKLNTARKGVILNMAFQLGINGLMKFRNMIRAIKKEMWNEAGIEMKHSKWYRQTPDRAQELIDKMVRG
jgi:lysozyme